MRPGCRRCRTDASTRPRRAPASGAGDLAALVLRLALGPMLVAHGTNKIAGGGGLKGTAGWFEGLGLRPGWLHARVAAATEIGAGTLLTLGAADPLPAAATIGLMATAAATDHRGKGFFIFRGGWEYVAVVGAAATALASLGSGRYSLDRLLNRRPRDGAGAAGFAVAVGLAGAVGLLVSSYRPNRPTDGEGPADEAPTDESEDPQT